MKILIEEVSFSWIYWDWFFYKIALNIAARLDRPEWIIEAGAGIRRQMFEQISRLFDRWKWSVEGEGQEHLSNDALESDCGFCQRYAKKNCQSFPFQTVKKFSFSNCQNFPFSNCQKNSFSNCQNFPFSNCQKNSFPNCQKFPKEFKFIGKSSKVLKSWTTNFKNFPLGHNFWTPPNSKVERDIFKKYYCYWLASNIIKNPLSINSQKIHKQSVIKIG